MLLCSVISWGWCLICILLNCDNLVGYLQVVAAIAVECYGSDNLQKAHQAVTRS